MRLPSACLRRRCGSLGRSGRSASHCPGRIFLRHAAFFVGADRDHGVNTRVKAAARRARNRSARDLSIPPLSHLVWKRVARSGAERGGQNRIQLVKAAHRFVAFSLS